MTRVNSKRWSDSIPLAFCYMMFMPIREFLPLRMLHWTEWPTILLKRAVLAVRLFFRYLECQARGYHHMARKAWVLAQDGWGHKSNGSVGEYHVGCTTCTRYWMEDENKIRKTKIQYWGLGIEENEE
jgi:hypothetical protein